MQRLQYDLSMRFTGAVLAGGKSSRFGQDKALYIYRNKPLIHWVLDSLNSASEKLVIASHSLGLTIPVYADLKPNCHSLGGIHAALSYAKNDWVAIAACDLPFLTPDYWTLLLGHTANSQIVMSLNQDEFAEPLAALYHRSILPIIEKQIETQDFTLHHLSTFVKTHTIPWQELEHLGTSLFFNANTRDDLPT